MIYIYILVAGIAGFVVSARYGLGSAHHWFFWGTPATLLATFIGRFFYFGIKDGVEEMKHRETVYKSSLDWLQTHPSDPQARQRALEAGRAYYEMMTPDTVTKVNGQVVNRTNNAANREAKIAADIEARLSHHRIAS